jgi:predicted RNase H-like nuclease (RuvC/YqgF family)
MKKLEEKIEKLKIKIEKLENENKELKLYIQKIKNYTSCLPFDIDEMLEQ